MKRRVNDAGRGLVQVGRRFDFRGWVLGTSGNFSVVVSRDPLRLAVTASGVPKGELTLGDILEVGPDGQTQPERAGRPSAEVLLHLAIASIRKAGAVLHTHSVWSTIVSERVIAQGGIELHGYEMLKGLEGVASHEHREWLPVLENDQDIPRLAGQIADLLRQRTDAHGFLIRRHGLYTWGDNLAQAVRHIEILEFLLEVTGRAGELGGLRASGHGVEFTG